MKSPEQLAEQLTRQWAQADWREKRLLRAGEPGVWPLVLTIGLPPHALFHSLSVELRQHLERWQRITDQGIGEVRWTDKKYSSGASPVRLPAQWVLSKPSDWVEAADDTAMRQDYRRLQAVLDRVDPAFWRLLVRRLALWKELEPQQVVTAARIAMHLTPGCAAGKPLRALALAGNDSKFFERHETLLKALLDERFDGEASHQGLAPFLGALDERDHWLLLVPLAPGLLPYARLRLTATDLRETPLPAPRILIVENEQSLHQLPRPLPDTIAILGAGFDLEWLSAGWLQKRDVAYWGDLDTWGMVMLGRARNHLPHLRSLLMDRATFDAHTDRAVAESVQAPNAPQSLQADELALFEHLKAASRGRLEQEFLTPRHVQHALAKWLAHTST